MGFSTSSSSPEQFNTTYTEYISYNVSVANITEFDIFSHNATDEDCNAFNSSVLTSTFFQFIIYTMYLTVIVLSLFGNSLVCHLVHKRPKMRSVTNFFILNLSIGDILMTILCIPFSFLSVLIMRKWVFGYAMCVLVSYSQAVSVFVSAYTLVAISIDRYIVIMHPLRPRMSKSQAKKIILLVWSVACTTALPIMLVTVLVQPSPLYEHCGWYICQERWDSLQLESYYNISLLVLQYVLPVTCLIFTYTMIAVVVWGKKIPGEAVNSRDRRLAKSKVKMIKMMVMVVSVYTICWLPFNILIILLRNDHVQMWEGLPYIWFLFHWLAMSHTVYSPAIYAYMNTRFRSGFITILADVPCIGSWIPVDAQQRGTSLNAVASTALTSMDITNKQSCTTYTNNKNKDGGSFKNKSALIIDSNRKSAKYCDEDL